MRVYVRYFGGVLCMFCVFVAVLKPFCCCQNVSFLLGFLRQHTFVFQNSHLHIKNLSRHVFADFFFLALSSSFESP